MKKIFLILFSLSFISACGSSNPATKAPPSTNNNGKLSVVTPQAAKTAAAPATAAPFGSDFTLGTYNVTGLGCFSSGFSLSDPELQTQNSAVQSFNPPNTFVFSSNNQVAFDDVDLDSLLADGCEVTHRGTFSFTATDVITITLTPNSTTCNSVCQPAECQQGIANEAEFSAPMVVDYAVSASSLSLFWYTDTNGCINSAGTYNDNIDYTMTLTH